MRTDHRCGQIHHVKDISDLPSIYADANDPIIIGGGSNVLFTQDIDRDLIVIEIAGITITQQDHRNVNLHIGAGEDWHDFVMWAISQGYGGIENLSLIPGRCGAAPMQNIGAYGVEIKDVLTYVEVYEIKTQKSIRLDNSQCEFGYRDSIFKKELKDKVVITAIGIKLNKSGYHRLETSYGAITSQLESNNVQEITIKAVSDAVIAIRQSKLPDPAVLANNGSFFKNPIISKEQYQTTLKNHPELPSYPVDEAHVKVPAGWLIDKAGWKGKRIGDVGSHAKQALVVVNFGGASGADVLSYAEAVAACRG